MRNDLSIVRAEAGLGAPPAANGAAPASTGPKRTVELVPLAGVSPGRVEWLWHSRLPLGRLSLIAGPEGVGKTTFLAWLLAEATHGRLPGDREGAPLGVVIASLEDDPEDLRPMVEAAGADLALVAGVRVSVDAHTPGALRLPDDMGALAERIRGAQLAAPVGLLIIDPIKEAATGRLKEDVEVRRLLAPLRDLAQREGIAVVVSSHFKKGAQDESYASWKVSGSPAWTQVPRSVLFIDNDPENPDDPDARVIAHAKVNRARLQPTITARIVTAHTPAPWGSIETSRLVLGAESTVRADELRSATAQVGARAEAEAFLRQYLSDGAAHDRKAIAAAAKAEGITDSTLKRAAKALRVEMRRFGSGDTAGSIWSLPDPSGPSDLGQRTPDLTQLTQATQANPKGHSGTGDRGACGCAAPLPRPANDGTVRCARCDGTTTFALTGAQHHHRKQHAQGQHDQPEGGHA